MAEDRPDRHPEPDPTAAEPQAPPSGGTGGSAPDGTAPMPAGAEPGADDPDGTAKMTSPGPAAPAANGSAGSEPAAGGPAADGTAKMAAGEDAPAEEPRPAPWRGAAAVPPPGPKKRRRFGLGRDDDEQQQQPQRPAAKPEKKLDPTLDLPAPVDPWEGSSAWDQDQPDQHYDYPAPPLHPTRIDRPDLPRTSIDRPSAAPPPPPPARPQTPQSPPRSQTPQPPRSQTPQPRSQTPQPPPQYAPPSYTRPQQQPPPPPPPAQSRPAPPVVPPKVAPPKKEKKRKKDRQAAARPQLPPGYPPPGYPPPTAARRPRRRRRRWPMVLLTMLLLTVACCCGVPAYFGTPVWQQYPASASTPGSISDLSLLTGDEADQATQTLQAEMRGEYLLAESTFAGVYGDGAGKSVTVFGVTGFRWSPEKDLDAEMTRLTDQYALSGVEPVEVGEVGGFQRCGTGEANGASVVVCGWADHGSLGAVVFTRRSLRDSAALLDRIRQSVITREQISISA